MLNELLTSLTIRYHLWKQAFLAWDEDQVFGIGWGEYSLYLLKWSDGYGMDRNAHNILLHFMAESGLIGTLLLIGTIVLCIPRKFKEEHIPLYAILGVQAIHSMLEFPYAYMQFAVVTALILGMISDKDRHDVA